MGTEGRYDILIVDDTPANLLLLSGILGAKGYRVRPASSGPQALRALSSCKPDLAILDVRMPGMGGIEVCQRMKAQEATRDIPVLFLSASGGTQDKIEGFEAGGLDYITKPFEAEELLARVATHLRLHELSENMERLVSERTSELRQRIVENETLLRELFHRTRNNMQVVIGILSAEADMSTSEPVKEMIQKTTDRIMSMSLVHSKLYDSRNLSQIDLLDYCRELIKLSLDESACREERICFDLEGEVLPVLIDTAVPFGLVFHELLSNELSHAFPGDASGQVRIRLGKNQDGTVRVDVEDDGRGLPEGLDPRKCSSLGFRLIVGLVEGQLNGSIEFGQGKGFSCHIVFEGALTLKRV